jgi:enterochelin esterase-like enzyme
MKKLLFLLLMLNGYQTIAQGDYSWFTNTVNILYSDDRHKIDSVWNALAESARIPLTFHDSVAFLYRGEAKSVSWMGDFNSWGYNKKFNNQGTRIQGTDIWILKCSFPVDSRLDYKVVVDDSNWILDPANINHQWSGVGGGSPNSELRMPLWKPDQVTISLIDGARRGRVQTDILVNSQVLGYQTTYSIYTPPDYNKQNVYPVVYVTDGYEYMHEKMGNMTTILDNLIHMKTIKPVIAVFIDHREPINRSNNRRMQELAMNEKYMNFISDELIPIVEKKYSVSTEPSQRAIIGSSMGGLAAAYFAFTKPNIFGLAGIQSPSFWFKPEIYTICDNPEKPPVKTFLSTGLINDTADAVQKMKILLDKNTCSYQYKEVNQGHSWGNWRDSLDDILVYFFQ